MIVAETFIELIKDPGHWMFEGVTDLIFAGAGALAARAWVKAHDLRHHSKKECEHGSV